MLIERQLELILIPEREGQTNLPVDLAFFE